MSKIIYFAYLVKLTEKKRPSMILLYIVIGLALLIFILSMYAPKTYSVERSILIGRPLPEVYEYVRFLENQGEWAKRNLLDPKMKKEYTGEDGKIGFQFIWDSNHKNVGSGQQTITTLEENEVIYTKLEFKRPFKSESDTYIRTAEAKDATTKVSWGFTGEIRAPLNSILLFINMDRQVGKDYEEGLVNLKRILEERGQTTG